MASKRNKRSNRARRPSRSGGRAKSGSAKAAQARPLVEAVRDDKPTRSGSLVTLLNQPAATATATAASMVGLLLALAPLVGSATVLALVGIPMLAWGIFQIVFRNRPRSVRIVGAVVAVPLAASAVLVVAKPIVEPTTRNFFYDGSLLYAEKDSPLHDVSFPPLTDDPASGREVDALMEATDLRISCWVRGHYKGQELEWAAIVDGDYTSLWIPLASLSVMGSGAVRTLLPCSNWRWRMTRAL